MTEIPTTTARLRGDTPPASRLAQLVSRLQAGSLFIRNGLSTWWTDLVRLAMTEQSSTHTQPPATRPDNDAGMQDLMIALFADAIEAGDWVTANSMAGEVLR